MSLPTPRSLLALLGLAACSGGGVQLGPDSPTDSEPPVDSEPAPAAACSPEVDRSTVIAEEGDTITLAVRCAEGGDPAQLTALGVPAGATFTGGTLRWETGLGDGGVYDLLFTGLAADGVPPSARVQLQVADAWDHPGNLPVDPDTYTWEHGLPVLHIDSGGSIGHDYVGATLTFLGERYDGDIESRGAASSYYPKVGYQIRVPDDHQLDLDAWGMGNKRRLVLLTTFDDNTYIRQALCYALWAEMAEHAGDVEDRLIPRFFFIVLYLDGEYHGLYLAIDRVDDEFVGQLGFDRESPVYKAYNHDANFYSTNASGAKKATWHDGYELKEGEDWLPLNELVRFAATTTDEEFVAQAADYLHEEQFIDWYLFVRFAAAGDSGGKNSYLVQDPATGLFRYAPWDFNQSWGQDWRTLRVGADNDDDFRWTNGIFAHYQDAAPERLEARWSELLASGPFGEAWLQDTVDELVAQTELAARRDWSKWADPYRSYGGWSWRTDFLDYDGELEYLRGWVAERVDWAEEVGP